MLSSPCWLLCASPLCLLFPPQVLELVSHSSRKDSTKTLLCLAEHAFLVPRCAASLEYVQYDVMQDNRQGLENCVTASDLILPHLSVCVHYLCVCMSVRAICRRVLSYLVHAYVCRFGFLLRPCVSFVGLYVIVSRPDSAEGFSSCPSTGSRNGEKDWENDSTTSSTPSNAEYTGIRHHFTVYTATVHNVIFRFCILTRVPSFRRTQTIQGA